MEKYLKVRIQGLSPLLMHPISDHAKRTEICELSKKAPEELLIRSPRDGRIAIPAKWFKHAIRGAAWKDTGNAYFLHKIVSPYIRFWGGFYPLLMQTGWTVYGKQRHLRAGEGSPSGIVRCPQWDEWACECIIGFEDSLIHEKKIQRLLGIAGRDIGVGLFTPEQHQAYGKFMAVSWQWTERPQRVVEPDQMPDFDITKHD